MNNTTNTTNASWFGANLYNFVHGTSSVTDSGVGASIIQDAVETPTYFGHLWSQTPSICGDRCSNALDGAKQLTADPIGTLRPWVAEGSALNNVTVIGQNAIRDYGIQTLAYPAAFLGGSYLSSYAIDYMNCPHIKAEKVGKIALAALVTALSISYGNSNQAGLVITALTGGALNVLAASYLAPSRLKGTQDQAKAKEDKTAEVQEAASAETKQPVSPLTTEIKS